ncbi:16S rRNA (guanine(527)-N(7))-methyltransferase RsmG [Methylovorus menthalis]|uniref:16S rRNA (guanine(527)-N(7))-methyltransferase RsmG n=1 Tax=Methylovorus menthalis TaxID=1002227 RepID=UPI001E617220|nr:16S rRNA (guanine(527)-N(7))-methyltransferase RsmG [Methylovorus menthalis]MCB4810112.1 16S rRNA (guanine(527)-N(7))-methyltransferase RsmG [Methylovorus menthalis]
MSQAEKLAAGIVDAGWVVSEETQQQLLAYLVLLQKWNKVHNLTAVRDPDEMVTLHLLDSLSVLPHVQALSPARLLDVGSGAGLPGIILALCMPDLQVTTIDAVQKKASFMRQAKAELGIANLDVVAGRVEQHQPSQAYDVVISRAFSEITLFIKLTRHLIAKDGNWLAMKGVNPVGELEAIGMPEAKVVALHVPGLDAQRHLVTLPSHELMFTPLSRMA